MRLGLALVVLFAPVAARGQTAMDFGQGGSPLVTAVALALLGLAPFLLVVCTSFAKMAVVLSILRSALGTQNVPPNVVLASLAVILSAYVMTPVATETHEVVAPMLQLSSEELRDVDAWGARWHAASEPLRGFLQVNAGSAELALFAELRDHEIATADAPLPLSIVLPAFTITELAEAFQIGFLLFLPFLVLDLFVGSVLLSLGMHMLSPTTVSMPFKLLLFIAVNGWIVLTQSLVLGYTYPGAT